MKVLLVRDDQTTKSAATLYVRSGSLNDPPEVNGIAHFCEHMLFMGSKNFPGISEYTDFLAKNGGSRNAATGEDFTFYFFDVKNEKLNDVLERFSDFFKHPLFSRDATDKEIN
jgi:insulysin